MGRKRAPSSGTPEDTLAVVDLMYEYCHALDSCEAERGADCFTPDGIWEARLLDGSVIEGHSFHGHDELLAYFLRIAERNPPGAQLHVLANPRVNVTGDTATAESYFTTLTKGESNPVLGSMGRYADRVERRSDGQWRFAERLILVRSD
jgi:uncharacterized protein (TIGR02246 family)